MKSTKERAFVIGIFDCFCRLSGAVPNVDPLSAKTGQPVYLGEAENWRNQRCVGK